MTTETQKKRNIKYLARDFDSLKKDLSNHIKVYFPDTYEDFNESSVGMMLLELMAFVGDNLSFYLDRKFNESFIDSATEAKNIFKHAKQLGFKAFGKVAATGKVSAFIKVPARKVNSQLVPDTRYAGVVKKGAKLKSSAGKTYETLVDVDFSKVNFSDQRFVVVGDRDPTTKLPTTFVLRVDDVDIKAGETKSTTVSVGDYEAFFKTTLTDDDVLEVISIKDADNTTWYEVDFLAQDTVFDSVPNNGSDATDVPYLLKLRAVPHRFITEYNPADGKTSITFGSGDAQELDGDLIPNVGDLSIPTLGKDAFSEYVIDPQNFLKTRTLGLAPVNTTLTVRYRVGGGIDTNAGANEITNVAESTFTVGDSTLSTSVTREVGNSFSVINTQPITGGRDEFTVEEVRQLIAANFAAQGRVVTAEDFIARALSMPSKFGSVFRAYAKPGALNKNSVELSVLAKDSSGYVTTAPDNMKLNLKKYLSRYRMMTDAIEILDGSIINLAVGFRVLSSPDYNNEEVLAECIEKLKEFFEIDKWQINQPIIHTQIIAELIDVPGVVSIYDLEFINKVGTADGRSYSTTRHNIAANTKNGILYCRDNAIFEVKYPNKDIFGTAK
jgi:hypothetical protein